MSITNIVIVVSVLLGVILMFNTLISRKNMVSQASGSIDAMLKKRYDLIPNLIRVVERYMRYEGKLLVDLTGLRTKAISGPLGDEQKVAVDNEISKTARRIMAIAENYPGVKSSEGFLHLQGSLNEVEEQISAARRFYNSAVMEYNNAVEKFPLCLIATLMGYKQKPMFEIAEEARKPLMVFE